MARENRSWGDDRIQGSLKHLGYTISDQTVGKILKRLDGLGLHANVPKELDVAPKGQAVPNSLCGEMGRVLDKCIEPNRLDSFVGGACCSETSSECLRIGVLHEEWDLESLIRFEPVVREKFLSDTRSAQ
jgi:hypothetical protein